MPHAQSTDRTVTLRYFAWVREKAGLSEERVTVPEGLRTVRDVLLWQPTRGESFANAFAKPDAIRVALDHVHARPETTIDDVREIGFFPPVTGG